MAIELHPLHQFEIQRLIPLHVGGIDISYTNSALLMTIVVAAITALMVFGTRKAALVPDRWQSIAEDAVRVRRRHGGHQRRPWRARLLSVRVHAVCFHPVRQPVRAGAVELHGDEPHHRHLCLVAGRVYRCYDHRFRQTGVHFLRLFVPEGVPPVLLVLLVPIEVLSYFIKPFTLSIRLFANMLAGHTMLAIFGGFAAAIGVFAIFPIAINIALVGLELLVAILQAYVFAILTCLYLHDSLHLH